MLELNDLITFNHLGLAVKDFTKAVNLYTSLGYKISDKVFDIHQNVELIMCEHHTQPNIELIKPAKDNKAILKILEKNNEIIYHTCYSTNSIKQAVSRLKKDFKLICLSEEKEAILFDNKKVSFYYIDGVGIFEFLEST